MIVAVPISPDGEVDPRWGRAARIAIADAAEGQIVAWREIDVGWDVLHDSGSEGSHHARVAGFLREQGVELVVAGHMGDGMRQMLASMGIPVSLGAAGDARHAVLQAAVESPTLEPP